MSNEPAPPGCSTPVAAKIMSPDRVETSIGTPEVSAGVPALEAAERVFDNLGSLRAVEGFLNCYSHGVDRSLAPGVHFDGADASNKLLILDELMNSEPFFTEDLELV